MGKMSWMDDDQIEHELQYWSRRAAIAVGKLQAFRAEKTAREARRATLNEAHRRDAALRQGPTDQAMSEDYSHAEFPLPPDTGMSDGYFTPMMPLRDDPPPPPPVREEGTGVFLAALLQDVSEFFRKVFNRGFVRDDLPDGAVMENGQRNQTTSAERFFGSSKIWGRDGEHHTPYMVRWWIGRLRLHVFYRGDQDPDCHDHPWDFWTFPLTSYVEEVAVTDPHCEVCDEPDAPCRCQLSGEMLTIFTERRVVPAFRLHFRKAVHTHRVLGRWNGRHEAPDPFSPGMITSYDGRGNVKPLLGYQPSFRPGKIVTLVWRSHSKRPWGFLKNRAGKWCWVPWKDYVFGSGKSAPCE